MQDYFYELSSHTDVWLHNLNFDQCSICPEVEEDLIFIGVMDVKGYGVVLKLKWCKSWGGVIL